VERLLGIQASSAASGALTRTSRSLSKAEITLLDSLILRTQAYHPSQELSANTLREYRLAFQEMAAIHGTQLVEEALALIRLESRFFPHPAEINLRIKQIQEERAAEQKRYRAALAAQKRVEEEQEHQRAIAAGEYADIAEIVEDFYRRRGQKPIEELPPPEDPASAIDRVMAQFSQGLARGEQYEPALVKQVREWEGSRPK